MLVTRPAHQSDAFARSLEAAGAIPVLAPVIAFDAPDDVQAAEQAVTRAPQYPWIVFTSANGVDAFFSFMDARREDARFLGSAKIAAIGSGTAAQLRRRCIYPDLIPQSFVAEDLAEALLAATREGDAILIFRAQEARDVLPQRLRSEGRNADVVAGYKTIIVRDPQFAQKTAQCDILTFTSASTVRGFIENTQGGAAAQNKIVACIGPITAQAARDAGMHVDVVATTFTAGGLCEALEQLRA